MLVYPSGKEPLSEFGSRSANAVTSQYCIYENHTNFALQLKINISSYNFVFLDCSCFRLYKLCIYSINPNIKEEQRWSSNLSVMCKMIVQILYICNFYFGVTNI